MLSVSILALRIYSLGRELELTKKSWPSRSLNSFYDSVLPLEIPLVRLLSMLEEEDSFLEGISLLSFLELIWLSSNCLVISVELLELGCCLQQEHREAILFLTCLLNP